MVEQNQNSSLEHKHLTVSLMSPLHCIRLLLLADHERELCVMSINDTCMQALCLSSVLSKDVGIIN